MRIVCHGFARAFFSALICKLVHFRVTFVVAVLVCKTERVKRTHSQMCTRWTIIYKTEKKLRQLYLELLLQPPRRTYGGKRIRLDLLCLTEKDRLYSIYVRARERNWYSQAVYKPYVLTSVFVLKILFSQAVVVNRVWCLNEIKWSNLRDEYIIVP